MDCRPTFTSKRRRRAGFTLLETLFSLSIGLMLLTATVALWAWSSRSFAGVYNYVDLSNASKLALDTMAREIRNAQSVVSSSATQLVLINSTGDQLTFTYNPNTQTLQEILTPKSGTTSSNALLTHCSSLAFSVFQKNPVGGTYDQYPAADATTAKVIQMAWTCSRPTATAQSNTERQISAKVVIRN